MGRALARAEAPEVRGVRRGPDQHGRLLDELHAVPSHREEVDVSSANRGAARKALDHYPTPLWAIAPIVAHLPRGGIALDVGCGEGSILGCLIAAGWDPENILGVDLDPARAATCRENWGIEVEVEDFLADKPWLQSFDLVIGNPPFTHAEAFARRAIDVVKPRRGTVALLLRLAFLETTTRIPFNRAHPADVFVLPLRPSFTGDGGTDSAAYGWFVWGPGRGGRWSILDVEKPARALRPKR